MILILTNDFHRTTHAVKTYDVVDEVGYKHVHLTANQVRRAKRALCGVAGCECGDMLGQRPSKHNPVPSFIQGEDDGCTLDVLMEHDA